jgi:GNAT superfamily N-acetyltransferase
LKDRLATKQEDNVFNFKPFEYTDHEYRVFSEIWNAYYPDEVYAPAELRHEDELRDPKYLFQRYVVEENRGIIGFCAYQETPFEYEPGKLHIAIYLDLDHLEQPYQNALYNFLIEQVAQHCPTKLVSMAREDKPERLRFYLDHGFRQIMRSPRSRLAVQEFEIDRYTPLMDKLRKENIELISVADLSARDPDWISKWREIEWLLLQDVPSTAPPEKQSLAVYEKLPEAPGFFPEGCFFAMDKGEMIALSFLWRTPADESLVFTGLTGTKREYRRRGIATALKVKSIQVAQKSGAEVIETSNEENNPMFQLNLQLGYKPAAAWLQLEKILSENTR